MTTATLTRPKEIFLPIYTYESYKERAREISRFTPIDSQLFRVEKLDASEVDNNRKGKIKCFINDDHIIFPCEDILSTINKFIKEGKMVNVVKGYGQIEGTQFYFDVMESYNFMKKYKTLK